MNNLIFSFFYSLSHRSPLLDQFIVTFAVYFPYMVVFLTGIFLLTHHEILSSSNPFLALKQKWKEMTVVFFSGVLAWLVAEGIKLLTHTNRPFLALADIQNLFPESGYTFPSQHMTFFTAIAVAIYFYHKRAGYLFLLFAFLIGLGRVMAGVHFPIDILGGFVVGALSAYLVARFANYNKSV